MAEHFSPDHIHTAPDGRHFRHGDGTEVDGEGNVIDRTSAILAAKAAFEEAMPSTREDDEAMFGREKDDA